MLSRRFIQVFIRPSRTIREGSREVKRAWSRATRFTVANGAILAFKRSGGKARAARGLDWNPWHRYKVRLNCCRDAAFIPRAGKKLRSAAGHFLAMKDDPVNLRYHFHFYGNSFRRCLKLLAFILTTSPAIFAFIPSAFKRGTVNIGGGMIEFYIKYSLRE